MVWAWLGWNSQSRAKCVLCNRTLGYYNDKPTCGTCFNLWKGAGGEAIKEKVALDHAREVQAAWEAFELKEESHDGLSTDEFSEVGDKANDSPKSQERGAKRKSGLGSVQ